MGLDILQPYFTDKPTPILESRTIQIILLRVAHDFAAFRTEENGALNTVTTPASFKVTNQSTIRVAMLAGKQRAAENRQMHSILKAATHNAGISIKECYHKDNLCLECPRCTIYGGTNVGAKEKVNIKHRISYSSAFSLMPVSDIESAMHFNAIYDNINDSKQAFGYFQAVNPNAVFPSVVTLTGVTKEEFILVVKTLLATKRYGAMTARQGTVRNRIIGIVGGWEEVITSLELTLAMKDNLDGQKSQDHATEPRTMDDVIESGIPAILGYFRKMAGDPGSITIQTGAALDGIIQAVQETALDKAYLDKIYKTAQAYRKSQLK